LVYVRKQIREVDHIVIWTIHITTVNMNNSHQDRNKNYMEVITNLKLFNGKFGKLISNNNNDLLVIYKIYNFIWLFKLLYLFNNLLFKKL
jgi:Leucine-rich repeat (LRR) protein